MQLWYSPLNPIRYCYVVVYCAAFTSRYYDLLFYAVIDVLLQVLNLLAALHNEAALSIFVMFFL